MLCPVFKVSPLYVKDNDGERCLWGVRYSDGVTDNIRIMKKPFLCSDGVTRKVIWVRRLGRVFVEWNDGRATLRAAESGLDGSVYTPASARKYVTTPRRGV